MATKKRPVPTMPESWGDEAEGKNALIVTGTCPVCGTVFGYHPDVHHWALHVGKGKKRKKLYFCRYNCMRTIERRQIEEEKAHEAEMLRRQEERELNAARAYERRKAQAQKQKKGGASNE